MEEEKIIKIVIAGSRTIDNYNMLLEIMKRDIFDLCLGCKVIILSGGARGVDQNAKQFALKNNLVYNEYKPIYENQHDKRAPLRRNEDMARDGDMLVCIWDGTSTGSFHMVNAMKKLGKPVYLYNLSLGG